MGVCGAGTSSQTVLLILLLILYLVGKNKMWNVVISKVLNYTYLCEDRLLVLAHNEIDNDRQND
jgi:hypothetical protein